VEKEDPNGIGSSKAFLAPAPTTIFNDSIMEIARGLVHLLTNKKDGTSVVGAGVGRVEN